MGFLGPNGAGKTTTIRILTGLARPTGGTAAIDGMDVVVQRDRVKPRIGYLAQSPAFYNYMTGEEFLHWTGNLFQMDRRTTRARAEEMLRLLGLWEARRRAIGGYSGGMRQRLGIAQALINHPQIVFLDEPVSSLDPVGRHEILMLIEQFKQEMTIFMSSHVLADVERVSDRVIIIDRGKVLVEASITELKNKYTAPIFRVEVDLSSPELSEMLRALPYVDGVRREGAVYRIAVSDAEGAYRRLPQALIDTGAIMIRYGIEAPSLEDIFLKVVNPT